MLAKISAYSYTAEHPDCEKDLITLTSEDSLLRKKTTQ